MIILYSRNTIIELPKGRNPRPMGAAHWIIRHLPDNIEKIPAPKGRNPRQMGAAHWIIRLLPICIEENPSPEGAQSPRRRHYYRP